MYSSGFDYLLEVVEILVDSAVDPTAHAVDFAFPSRRVVLNLVGHLRAAGCDLLKAHLAAFATVNGPP